MVEKELRDLIESIRVRGCEGQTIEVKAARQGCPERLYDTISAFSNQNSGGIFVFGLEEKNGFAKVGVYDAQDLERKVKQNNQTTTSNFPCNFNFAVSNMNRFNQGIDHG